MKTKISSHQGIIFLTPAEYVDEEEALVVVNFAEKIVSKSIDSSYPLIVNLNGYRGHDKNVKAILGKYLRDKKDRVPKIAIVSDKLDKVSEIAIMTIFALGGFTNFKFFKQTNEAVNWISKP